jgi:hypothetical protein
VTVDEIIRAVNIALGNATLSTCPLADIDGNGGVSVNEIVQGVNNALSGCPLSGPGGGAGSGCEGTPPTLRVGSVLGSPGTTIAVPISLSGSANAVAAVQLDVLFNNAQLSLPTPNAACVIDSRLPQHSVHTSMPAAGRLRLIVVDLTGPTDLLSDGTLATCSFQVAPGAPAGAYPLPGENAAASNAAGAPLAASIANGAIILPTPTPTPTATVTPTPPTGCG